MAEKVELMIEKMIPELEEMERTGLLSNVEVRKLIQKRKNFEYRLARRTRSKLELINYVNYEKKLLELLRIRRKQLNLNEKRGSIDGAIAKRCIEKLVVLTRMWPRHLDTWALRIKFTEFLGWKEEVSRTYRAQTKFHAENVNVWIAWAKYELEWKSNFDGARNILVSSASRHHPKSIQLKRELFRLELSCGGFESRKPERERERGNFFSEIPRLSSGIGSRIGVSGGRLRKYLPRILAPCKSSNISCKYRVMILLHELVFSALAPQGMAWQEAAILQRQVPLSDHSFVVSTETSK
ncbi:U3 small nucleolar RNA-associated protein 6 homolog [Penaeus japonicus]|uniref:U3 small nucleolar RNA-associated protein 6 homolog n=1 Tax=Penaeus japonicus TaxID=27405 RepID=UPI001C711881|nr:U3 small nucleolar RNA-associated protein 6 homolog [Penaeus japonicus]